MSKGDSYPYELAVLAAGDVVDILTPYTLRRDVVGSIRRRRSWVHDLEILVEPAAGFDLVLYYALTGAENSLPFSLRSEGGTADGERYKKLWYGSPSGQRWPVDLFICRPPAQYGWLKVLRTGSADWTQQYLLWRKPPGLAARNGALYQDGKVMSTPDEEQVFTAFGRLWVPPTQREM